MSPSFFGMLNWGALHALNFFSPEKLEDDINLNEKHSTHAFLRRISTEKVAPSVISRGDNDGN